MLVNSDNLFSPDWLENLYKHYDENTIVCSQLIERKHEKHPVFPLAIHGEFGNSPETFKEQEFLDFADSLRENEVYEGGAYMPCMASKQTIGHYPEGNPIVSGRRVSGDNFLFDSLALKGVKHITAKDSIVYHFKEGEMDE